MGHFVVVVDENVVRLKLDQLLAKSSWFQNTPLSMCPQRTLPTNTVATLHANNEGHGAAAEAG